VRYKVWAVKCFMEIDLKCTYPYTFCMKFLYANKYKHDNIPYFMTNVT
jgi:hypothetical protein